MKFEVEVLEDGRCIIPRKGYEVLMVPDVELGPTLRALTENTAPEKKTKKRSGRPAGGRNKPKAEPAVAGAEA